MEALALRETSGRNVPVEGWGQPQQSRRLWARLWFARILAVGLGLTVLQVGLACLFSGKGGLRHAYQSLYWWDAFWYGGIVLDGYTANTGLAQNNTAFLPAYPLLSRALRDLTRLDYQVAQTLAAQLACWGFWTYVLLFLRLWSVPTGLSAVGVVLIAAHPAAFYLVVPYSESLYLACLLGFLYWSAQPGLTSGLAAAAHGCAMTATRIVGLPLIGCPLLHAWLKREPGPHPAGRWRWVRLLTLGGLASLGALLYFAYCHERFGHWDMYMKTSAAGWGVRFDLLGWCSPHLFNPRRLEWIAPLTDQRFIFQAPLIIEPNVLSRVSIWVMFFLFAALGLLEWRLARSHAGSGWRQRAVFYVCGWLMFFVPLCSHAGIGWLSMIRFSLCVAVMLVLALVHLLARVWPLYGWRDRALTAFVTAWSVLGFVLQAALIYRFTHREWVA